jgi:hypothetical protein
LQDSNQEEEMKRMNNGVQGVSNRGCWKTRQYNVQCQERNQEEERKNRKPTQLDGVLQESKQEGEMKRMNNGVQGVSNRGCWKTRQYNVQCQERNQEEERKNR